METQPSKPLHIEWKTHRARYTLDDMIDDYLSSQTTQPAPAPTAPPAPDHDDLFTTAHDRCAVCGDVKGEGYAWCDACARYVNKWNLGVS